MLGTNKEKNVETMRFACELFYRSIKILYVDLLRPTNIFILFKYKLCSSEVEKLPLSFF